MCVCVFVSQKKNKNKKLSIFDVTHGFKNLYNERTDKGIYYQFYSPIRVKPLVELMMS